MKRNRENREIMGIAEWNVAVLQKYDIDDRNKLRFYFNPTPRIKISDEKTTFIYHYGPAYKQTKGR